MELTAICPTHSGGFSGEVPQDGTGYRRLVAEHCARAEEVGVAGMLVYDFWQALDPWTVAQQVLSCSRRLEPIVAVQSALSHPAEVARRVASLRYLHDRDVRLNVVAGAKRGELAALGAVASDGARHERSASFVECVRAMLEGRPYRSRFFDVAADAPSSRPPARLPLRVLTPGSSSPGFAALAPVVEDCMVMAKPLDLLAQERDGLRERGFTGGLGMVVGIVARQDEQDARAAAAELYGGDRRDELLRGAFAREAQSTQHQANFRLARESTWHDECLWYGAARAGIDTPKLVGSYAQVAAALDRYRASGVTSLILDLPHAAGEYRQIGRALALAGQGLPGLREAHVHAP